nr:hypothetical protein [Tanacetum cinerariifolium]
SYDWIYQAEEEPANYALMDFSNSSSDNEVLTQAMFDCENYYSSESDCESWPRSSLYDRFQPSGGYHVVPPPFTGTFLPPKPDLPIETSIPAATPATASPKFTSSGKRHNRKACFVCKSVDHLIKDCDYRAKKMAQPTQRNYTHRGNHKQSALLTHKKPQKHMVPTAVLTQSKPVFNTAVRPVSADVPKIMVTRPRLAHLIVTKSTSPIRRESNHPIYVQGNPQHALKDKGVIDSGCSMYMIGNMSYLSDFEELNGGYVAFGGNPKGGKIFGKEKIKTGKFKGKVDKGFLVGYSANSKAFRVFNNRTRIIQETLHVNFLENKPNGTSSGPTWLFDIDSLTRTMNYQPVNAGNQSNPSADVASDEKEHDFDAKKPESEVILSPSSSAQSRKQDDKTKKEANGKSHDITYSNDEDIVVAEADFNNLESSILVSHIPTTRIHKDHPVSQTISDLSSTTQTRSMTKEEPKRVLVSLPYGKRAIGTKWVYKNKEDERGIVIRKKERLVAQGHTQEEEIDYEEVFAPVARIKAIRLFLAYASFMGFMALYGLHQAPRAWYETLATYLLENGFQRGIMDQTLFIKKQKGVILLVQIYVDDIIFGATNKDLCKSFKKLMKDKFQMSSMGELTFFLGLQVKQKKDGIFIYQDKYIADILRKFRLTKGKSASTLIDTKKPLLKDPDGEDVDVHTYRLMIGSLMYLTSSRPDIMFVVCACARFQVTPKASHLHAVKKIVRYLKGKPHLGLWYLKDSPFDLVAYSDSDYAGASLDRKSTSRGCQFLGCRLISWQCKKQTIVATSSTEVEYVAAQLLCTSAMDSESTVGLWVQFYACNNLY